MSERHEIKRHCDLCVDCLVCRRCTHAELFGGHCRPAQIMPRPTTETFLSHSGAGRAESLERGAMLASGSAELMAWPLVASWVLERKRRFAKNLADRVKRDAHTTSKTFPLTEDSGDFGVRVRDNR